MRILVCGGRDYNNNQRANEVLNVYHSHSHIDVVITGGAPGADTLANRWAQEKDILNEQYPANWNRFKKAAGPIRNNQMLKEGQPDEVLAFPGGSGTADMVKKALLAGLPVWEVDEDEEEPNTNTND